MVLMGQLEEFERNARNPDQQGRALPGVGRTAGAPVVTAEAYIAGAPAKTLRKDVGRNLGLQYYLSADQFDEHRTDPDQAKRVRTMRCVRIVCARGLLPRARALDVPHLLRHG